MTALKKTLNILALLLLVIKLSANPIYVPEVLISELYFDSLNDWQVELRCDNPYFWEFSDSIIIDSIWISSSSGESFIKGFPRVVKGEISEYEYYVVTKDSLNSEINIDPEGDTISIIYFTEGYGELYNGLIFGNCPGSEINSPKSGQSIAYIEFMYYKDNSPTIGYMNSIEGVYGTLQGIIYDINDNPVARRIFELEYQFETDSNGSYSTFLLRNHNIDCIRYIAHESSPCAEIIPISVNVEPDTVIDMDIYLLDSLITGLNESIRFNDFPIKVYPNPIKKNQNINYEIDLPVKSMDCYMELVSLDGKVITRKKIIYESGIIELPVQTTEDLYLLNVQLNNSIRYSTKLIITK